MSWHYLQGQEEVSSEGISWDGVAFVPSKLKTTLGAYCLLDSETASCPASPYGMTLRPLLATPGVAAWMWCQEGSLVRAYQPPAVDVGLRIRDQDYGPKWPGSLAKYNPHSYSWRTAQCSLFGGLIEFSGTWPRWGMMQAGECWELSTPVRRKSAKESGYWPTPTKSDGTAHRNNPETMAKCYGKPYQQRPSYRYAALYGKNPSSNLWAYLMGWPLNWALLKPMETAKFQQWLDSHGRR